MPAIKLVNISKKFLIPTVKVDSLRERLFQLKLRTPKRVLPAINGLDLEVKAGEWLGVIGANGSGKSTLLKVIAGIFEPDGGQVTVSGRLVPFLELGVGFNPDLSARDNIFLNGVILGMRRRKIREKFGQIVKFAGMGQFVNQTLKNFSSGMQLRLAFSIAIQSSGDIFLLDEVLAVGDHEFRQKSKKVFARMKRDGKTALIVSHELDQIKEHCDRVIWLDKGKIKLSGSPASVIKAYTKST